MGPDRRFTDNRSMTTFGDKWLCKDDWGSSGRLKGGNLTENMAMVNPGFRGVTNCGKTVMGERNLRDSIFVSKPIMRENHVYGNVAHAIIDHTLIDSKRGDLH